MNRFDISFAVLILIIAFGVIGGCGGDDCRGFCPDPPPRCSDLTDFKIVDITNGPNAQEANSFWSCTNDFDEEYELSIYADGTGESTAFGGLVFEGSELNMEIGGSFFWRQIGCRIISISSPDNYGLGQIFSIDGSSEDGRMTHSQILDREMDRRTDVSCNLVLLVQ